MRSTTYFPQQHSRSPCTITIRSMLCELTMVLGVVFAYSLTRGLARAKSANATRNAEIIMRTEQALHLDVERMMQAFGLTHLVLVHAANICYVVGHLPVLIGVGIWLYGWRPPHYLPLRNAFLLTAIGGLMLYVRFPVASPRFFSGFTDTLQRDGFSYDESPVGLFYNPYAAMPSLQVGWALLAGIAVVRGARGRALKIVGAIYPVLMMLAVVITANHYVLDIAAGVALSCISLGLTLPRSPRHHLWQIGYHRGVTGQAQSPGDARHE